MEEEITYERKRNQYLRKDNRIAFVDRPDGIGIPIKRDKLSDSQYLWM